MGLGEGGRKRGTTKRYLVGLPSHQNLVEQVDVVVSRCVAELRRALPRPTSKPLSVAPPAEWKPAPPPHIARRQDARQEARQARYEQVLALRLEGCNAVEIAERLGMKSRTVAR